MFHFQVLEVIIVLENYFSAWELLFSKHYD